MLAEDSGKVVVGGYVDRFRTEIRDPGALSKDALGVVLHVYGREISRIFLPLMVLAYSHGASNRAKELLWGNVEVEVHENHIEMLRTYAACAAAYADDDRVRRTLAITGPMIEDLFVCCLRSAAAGFALMALWEGLSVVFMPVLRRAGALHGADDFTYPDVHAEADIGHAEDCARALALECLEWGCDFPSEALEKGYKLMVRIFSADLS